MLRLLRPGQVGPSVHFSDTDRPIKLSRGGGGNCGHTLADDALNGRPDMLRLDSALVEQEGMWCRFDFESRSRLPVAIGGPKRKEGCAYPKIRSPVRSHDQ